MLSFKSRLNCVLILGNILFSILFFWAIYYFKERHYYDTAYYLLQIINTGSFEIEHGRFIAVATQIWPYLGLKAHVSLPSLMLIYSIGEVFYYYLLFNICVFALKDASAALAILLIEGLSVLFMFFCPISELQLGSALLIIAWHLLKKAYYYSPGQKLLLSALLFTILFSHPLAFILVLCIFIDHFLSLGKKINNHFLFIIVLNLIFFLVKFASLDFYDSSKIKMHANPANGLFMQLVNISYMKMWIIFYFTKYYWVLILLCFTIFIYFKNKQFEKLLFLISSYLFCIFLILCTHYAPALTNYTERIYYPSVIVVIIFFSECAVHVISKKRFWLAIFICLALITANQTRIFQLGQSYKARFAITKQLCNYAAKKGICKAVVDEGWHTYIDFGWALAISSLMLSSMDGPENTVQIARVDDFTEEWNKITLTNKQYLVYSWLAPSHNNQLNKKYFKSCPQVYQPLFHSSDTIAISTFANIQVKANFKEIYDLENLHFATVFIKNSSLNTLFAGIGKASVQLCTFAKGSNDTLCTYLLADLQDTLHQAVQVPNAQGAELKIMWKVKEGDKISYIPTN